MFILHGLWNWIRGLTYCVFCLKTIVKRNAHVFYGRTFCNRECVVRDYHTPASIAYLLHGRRDELDAIARLTGAV